LKIVLANFGAKIVAFLYQFFLPHQGDCDKVHQRGVLVFAAGQITTRKLP
jgi:hypothetical protein